VNEPGIDLNGAGIDMYPGQTDSLVSAIGTAQSTLDSAWRPKLDQVMALSGQLGKGPMGRALAAQYNPAEEQIVDGMSQLKTRVDELVTDGHTAVRDYVKTDQQQAGQFRVNGK
jgi:hypothetical protein